MIYICMSVCLWETHTKNGMQNAWSELRVPNTRMLNVNFGSLKQSADYNFCLEFLILLSSDLVKTDLWHPYYSFLQAALAGMKKKPKKTFT